jgi:signal peptidase I
LLRCQKRGCRLIQLRRDQNPLIKIIKAIPGDKFNLQKADNGWNIIVKKEVLKNSAGEAYVIDHQAHQMLSLYINDYKGIIPENTYLLLGNLANGSLDSTHFGLVDKSDILGKAEIIK